ncbi:glucoamylase family protein [Aliiglaciecola sp. LCG003]|uniref:glucoamylase family protein n=1 Tax=Aliiglaciecola sp. LCG003 TaxID=3053655 RepID=UPI0025724713|nr:glucoamylase family protein [Aliiglaciecola sp. LCG003]WJG08969.1 glucoamylase family protein [Aliiglaciecola sp. LCG003]
MIVLKNYPFLIGIAVLLISMFSNTSSAAEVPVLNGQAYDQHVELHWDKAQKQDATYNIYVSVAGQKWQLRHTTQATALLDFVGELGSDLSLKYKLTLQQGDDEVELAEISLATHTFTDDELLEMVQAYTFRYFWPDDETATGWAKERIPNGDGNIVTSGGTGFGILALITGAERGWASRERIVKQLLRLTESLKQAETFHGMWAHWYRDGEVFHFSKYDDGGDIVESAFLIQGLLTARQYFANDNDAEKQLRADITQLWESMQWDWYTRYELGTPEKVLTWHWSKKHGWKMDHHIRGYNEALIVYILAASSPTHSIDADVYHQGWAAGEPGHQTFENGQGFYANQLPLGPAKELGGPLFFAHYSYLGLDPRGLSDRYADYWQQNKNHALINRAYAIDNPKGWTGYGEDFWGITAGDMLPDGYSAHAPGERDQGTINPTGALSSMPYTPKESLKVLRNLYYKHGKEAFGMMGFYDAVNLSVSDDPKKQVRKTYLAIDQGPIVAMIENYRSGLLWKHFMQDKDVQRGLAKLGFTVDSNSAH